MTDRPQRLTIAPTADRNKKTDPPLPTDKPPPEDLLNLSENVLVRLANIEGCVADTRITVDGISAKVTDLHELLMGADQIESDSNGRPRTLPELIAERLASKVFALFQEQLIPMREDMAALKVENEALLARIDQVAEIAGVGTNGNGTHE